MLGLLSLALGLSCWPQVGAAADGAYRQLQEIAIGGEGGWDYLSVDAAGHRLGADGKPQRPQIVPGSFKVVVCERADKPSR